MCGTCTQNKHQCAGYGDETSPTDATKDGKKVARREATTTNTATATTTVNNAPAVKVKQETAAQPSRPQPAHTCSTASHTSDVSPNRRLHHQDEDAGMLRWDLQQRSADMVQKVQV